MTASIGVSSSELFPTAEVTAANPLAAADGALYEAKHAGRNRICVAAARPLVDLSGVRLAEAAAVQPVASVTRTAQ